MKIKIAKKFIGTRLGLYDSQDPLQSSITAKKVIDITDICNNSAQAIIKYAICTRGQIAQICDLYKKNKDLGRTIHYHINEYDEVKLAEEESFKRTAFILGVNTSDLARVVFNNRLI